MTETHGTDTVNERISVKGLEFSSLLTIGAAKWLERKVGKPIMAVANELSSMGQNIEVTKLAVLVTALRIAACPGIDPQQAEAEVDALSMSDFLDIFNRATPFQFEPKNSQEPEAAQMESTGQPSSTT